MQETPPDATPGSSEQLGRYRVVGRLGDTAIGRVLAATDPSGRRVAVTIVVPEVAGSAGFRERFAHEVRVAASAPPWFVAALLDAEPDADPPWFVEALVDGPPLAVYVGENGPLGPAGVAALATRLAEGLVALHGAGLAHEGLTPATVLLAEEGPRLVGTGAARLLGGEGPTGDMRAFGALLCFAATGRDGIDLAGLTGPVREVAAACLSEDPARRPTAAQAAAALRTPAPGGDPLMPAVGADGATVIAPVPWESPGPAGRPPAVGADRSAGAWSGGATAIGPVVPNPWPGGASWTGDTVGGGTAYGPPPYPSPAPRHRSWLPLVAVAVVALLVVGGAVYAFTRGNGGGGTTPSTSPTAPASPTIDPAAGTVPVEPATLGTTPKFRSPTGNIACIMTGTPGGTDGGARCDVATRTWSIPAQPSSCTAAWGQGAQVQSAGMGALTCANDTLADASLTQLDYGRSVSLAGVVCVSRETGVRCTNAATGHGFRVARNSYELF